MDKQEELNKIINNYTGEGAVPTTDDTLSKKKTTNTSRKTNNVVNGNLAPQTNKAKRNRTDNSRTPKASTARSTERRDQEAERKKKAYKRQAEETARKYNIPTDSTNEETDIKRVSLREFLDELRAGIEERKAAERRGREQKEEKKRRKAEEKDSASATENEVNPISSGETSAKKDSIFKTLHELNAALRSVRHENKENADFTREVRKGLKEDAKKRERKQKEEDERRKREEKGAAPVTPAPEVAPEAPKDVISPEQARKDEINRLTSIYIEAAARAKDAENKKEKLESESNLSKRFVKGAQKNLDLKREAKKKAKAEAEEAKLAAESATTDEEKARLTAIAKEKKKASTVANKKFTEANQKLKDEKAKDQALDLEIKAINNEYEQAKAAEDKAKADLIAFTNAPSTPVEEKPSEENTERNDNTPEEEKESVKDRIRKFIKDRKGKSKAAFAKKKEKFKNGKVGKFFSELRNKFSKKNSKVDEKIDENEFLDRIMSPIRTKTTKKAKTSLVDSVSDILDSDKNMIGSEFTTRIVKKEKNAEGKNVETEVFLQKTEVRNDMGNTLLNIVTSKDENFSVMKLKENKEADKSNLSLIIHPSIITESLQNHLAERDDVKKVLDKDGNVISYSIPVSSVEKTNTGIIRYKMAGDEFSVSVDGKKIIASAGKDSEFISVYSADKNEGFNMIQSNDLLEKFLSDKEPRFTSVAGTATFNTRNEKKLSTPKPTDLLKMHEKDIIANAKLNGIKDEFGNITYNIPDGPRFNITNFYDAEGNKTSLVLAEYKGKKYFYGRNNENGRETPGFQEYTSIAMIDREKKEGAKYSIQEHTVQIVFNPPASAKQQPLGITVPVAEKTTDDLARDAHVAEMKVEQIQEEINQARAESDKSKEELSKSLNTPDFEELNEANKNAIAKVEEKEKEKEGFERDAKFAKKAAEFGAKNNSVKNASAFTRMVDFVGKDSFNVEHDEEASKGDTLLGIETFKDDPKSASELNTKDFKENVFVDDDTKKREMMPKTPDGPEDNGPEGPEDNGPDGPEDKKPGPEGNKPPTSEPSKLGSVLGKLLSIGLILLGALLCVIGTFIGLGPIVPAVGLALCAIGTFGQNMAAATSSDSYVLKNAIAKVKKDNKFAPAVTRTKELSGEDVMSIAKDKDRQFVAQVKYNMENGKEPTKREQKRLNRILKKNGMLEDQEKSDENATVADENVKETADNKEKGPIVENYEPTEEATKDDKEADREAAPAVAPKEGGATADEKKPADTSKDADGRTI